MRDLHCLCYRKLIRKIVAEAKYRELKSITEISQVIGCADKCELCVPYIEEAMGWNKSSDSGEEDS